MTPKTNKQTTNQLTNKQKELSINFQVFRLRQVLIMAAKEVCRQMEKRDYSQNVPQYFDSVENLINQWPNNYQ